MTVASFPKDRQPAEPREYLLRFTRDDTGMIAVTLNGRPVDDATLVIIAGELLLHVRAREKRS